MVVRLVFTQLVMKYPGVIVPPCPPKDAVGTGFAKMKGAASDNTRIVFRLDPLRIVLNFSCVAALFLCLSQ